jgi:hypothetical protein
MKNESFGTKFKSFGYKKLKWDQEKLSNYVNSCIINRFLLRYISDYFHINIFLLDIEKDQLIYCSKYYIPYKKHIFLLHFKNNFEPFIMEHAKSYTNEDIPVKYILQNSNKIRILSDVPNDSDTDYAKFESQEEDLDKYITKNIIKLREKKLTYKEIIKQQQLETLKNQQELEKIRELEKLQELQSQKKNINSPPKMSNMFLNYNKSKTVSPKSNSSNYSTHVSKNSDSDTHSQLSDSDTHSQSSDSDTQSSNSNSHSHSHSSNSKSKNKYTEKTLTNMKLVELQQLAKTNNISISDKIDKKTKPKNKKKLIVDILSHFA